MLAVLLAGGCGEVTLEETATLASTVSTALKPDKGKPDHPFSIHDKDLARLNDGSRAVFTESASGADYIAGLRTHTPYKSAHGRVPSSIPPGVTYAVTVVPGTGVAFAVGSFLVVGEATSGEPASISPTMGPAGTAFTILDPQNRIQPGDVALFYMQGEDPTTGIPATDVVVAGNNTLQGKVPQTANTNMLHYVTVRPTPTSPSRFEDLPFTISG